MTVVLFKKNLINKYVIASQHIWFSRSSFCIRKTNNYVWSSRDSEFIVLITTNGGL